MLPLVSICIPTYNSTNYFKCLLDSIFEQTYTNYEIIITDDSNNNFVLKTVEEYEKKGKKIIYRKNLKQLGTPSNWNECLQYANGELIKFMHHDDWFNSSTALEIFVGEFIKDRKLNFVFCTSKILNVKTDTFTFNLPNNDFISTIQQKPEECFLNNLIGSPSAVMFKKPTILFDTKIKYLVDVDFYIRLLNLNNSFIFIKNDLIVNTSNQETQVTAESLDIKTQVGEYVYMSNKLFKGKIPPINVVRFLRWRFISYKI